MRAMRLSSVLGWSCGWVVASVFHALDVGHEDPLFVPALVLAVPGLMGIGAAAVNWKKRAEVLDVKRVAGFFVLATVVATLAVVALIALFLDGHGVVEAPGL
jgi:hypothetical protein